MTVIILAAVGDICIMHRANHPRYKNVMNIDRSRTQDPHAEGHLINPNVEPSNVHLGILAPCVRHHQLRHQLLVEIMMIRIIRVPPAQWWF